jgi:hypothetical protein
VCPKYDTERMSKQTAYEEGTLHAEKTNKRGNNKSILQRTNE